MSNKIYEDKYFVAINKAPGVVADNVNFPMMRLIHRLDKDTSGVLLLVKNPNYLESFQELFKRRVIKKTYLGLFFGHVLDKGKNGFIEAPIKRIPNFREKFGVVANGRPSQTAFKVLKYFKYKGLDLSLVEVHPLTGRTHQIRVHFTSLHHPVVGDRIYGPARLNDEVLSPRQFLHAKAIAFKHPYTGEALRIEAALPEDLRSFLKIIERFSGVNDKNEDTD